MRRLVTWFAVLALAAAAAAHDCPTPLVELELDETTGQILIVEADLEEVETHYAWSFVGPADVVDVTPIADTEVQPGEFLAHDAVFTFTGKKGGTTRLRVDWYYPDTQASGICFTDIVVRAPLVAPDTVANHDDAEDTEEPVSLLSGEYFFEEAVRLFVRAVQRLAFSVWYGSLL